MQKSFIKRSVDVKQSKLETFSSVPTRDFGVFSAELRVDSKLFPKSDQHQLTDPIWLLLKKKRQAILIHSLVCFLKKIFNLMNCCLCSCVRINPPTLTVLLFLYCSLFAVQIQLDQLICCYNNTVCKTKTIIYTKALNRHIASTTARGYGRPFHLKSTLPHVKISLITF